MNFHQRLKQLLHLLGLRNQIHQEIVHATEEGAPFEEIAADHDHDGAVGCFTQGEGVGAKGFPESLIAGVIPRTVRKRRPVDFRHCGWQLFC